MNLCRSSTVFITASVLVGLLIVSSACLAAWDAPARDSKTGSSLALLSAMQHSLPDYMPEDARPFVDHRGVRAVVSFNRKPGQSDLVQIRGLGAVLDTAEMHAGNRWHKGGHLPWQALQALSRLPFVESIDSAWQPGVTPTLDLSAEVVGATGLWPAKSPNVLSTAGEKVVIADFDTSVDVFHPGLWRADGFEYDWIDVDGNGSFDSGIDAVDLNGNGLADPGETLRFFKAPVKDYRGIVSNSTGQFNSKLDWLYNDANANGVRDYGLSFGESTPTYGEQIFILRDLNGNGAVDIGEKLVALNTSMVTATLGDGGITRRRGIDLIHTAPDTFNHATAVCGILAGEEPWLRSYVGISPGVDIIVADRSKNDFTTYIPWAKAHGARVMLYEFGAWTYQFMDGTSALEQAISAEWESGITQVIPAGNLANAKKHAVWEADTVPADFSFAVPSGISVVYLTALWVAPLEDLSFTLTNPAGTKLNLQPDGVFRGDDSGNFYWSFGVLKSPRDTHRMDVCIAGVTNGTWRLDVTSPGSTVEIHAYISDNLADWTKGAYFTSHISSAHTVTWPATADKSLVVGSFSPRGISVPAGDLSAFSARGPRIDGKMLIDLCAPGNRDIFAICSKDAGNPPGSYKQFTGTSAAAPHVAGACALLIQINPLLTSDQIAYLLASTARTDGFTAATPNHKWGYGKLDVLAASAGASQYTTATAASAREAAEGTELTLFAKLVTAVAADGSYFYVGESDRSSGIRVLGSGVAEGDKVSVSGIVSTVGAEKVIQLSSMVVLQHSQVPLQPLGMGNSALGGWPAGAMGPCNTGLLVTTWGRVVEQSAESFVLDDGSGFRVQVFSSGLVSPQMGSFVRVSGISSLTGEARAMVLPRRQSDIVPLL